jgi:hypothetical protein
MSVEFSTLVVKADSREITALDSSLQKLINSSTGVEKTIYNAEKSISNAANSASYFYKELDRADAITKSMLSPLEKYNNEVADLKTLLSGGAISQETFSRATEKASKTYADLSGETDRLTKEIQEYNNIIGEGKRVTDSVKTSSEKYKDTVHSLDRLVEKGAISQNTYSRAVKKAKIEMKDASRSASFFGSSLMNLAAAAGGIYAIKRAIGGINDLAQAGSGLNETMSKASVVLGSAYSDVEKWASTAASTIGQTKEEALNGASTFGIFAKSAGLSGKELGNFTMQYSTLASDFASFYNTSPEEAIVAIGAAFRGENEPIRRYGILLDDMSMRQAALKQGIISTTKNALTPQQKVLAAGALIMQQSADAQGDFARTADQLANKQRIATAVLENNKAVLGEKLLPLMTDFYDMLIKIANVTIDPLTDTLDGLVRKIQEIRGVSIDEQVTGEFIEKAMKQGAKGVGMLEGKIHELEGTVDQHIISIQELEDYYKTLKPDMGIFKSAEMRLTEVDIEKTKKALADYEKQLGSVNNALTKMYNAPAEKKVTGNKISDPAAEERAKEEAQKSLNKAKEEGMRLTESLYTPLEALAAKEKELDGLIAKKAITEEIYNKAKKQYTEEFNKSVQYEIDALTNGLLTEEEQIRQSYERRNQAILESTALTEEQKAVIRDKYAKQEQERQISKTRSEYENLSAGLLTEEEEYQRSYQKRYEMIQGSGLNSGDKEDLLSRLDRERTVHAIENNQKILGSYGDMFSGIMDATAAFGGKQTAFYKAMFLASKGFALAESIMAIQAGLAKSASIGFPQNLLAIGPYIAQTAGIIASISSVKFKDKGGYLSSNEIAAVEEIGPEIIRGPAQVTSRNKTAQMFDELKSNGGGKQVVVHVSLNNSNFIGNNAALRDFGVKIADVVGDELTRKGAIA